MDHGGVAAISFSTWGLFLLSNISAIAYALVNMADWTMATMFLGNAAGCTIILLVGAWKRMQHRNRFQNQPALIHRTKDENDWTMIRYDRIIIPLAVRTFPQAL